MSEVANDPFALADEWGPEKIVCVSDSRTGMRGILVIDNTARGPGKGGTRMSSTLQVGEVARLARTMTWKWASVDLFQGGAKAGILGDPHAENKQEILRAFARALRNEVPAEYVLGLDMGLAEADAAILRDELGDRGAAVGLPAALGGVPYDEWGTTGFGVAEAADEGAAVVGLDLAGARVAIQGFGAVGVAAARRLTELGASIVAVSTAQGALVEPDGLILDQLLALAETEGAACVHAYDGPVLGLGSELRAECDVLIPAAREDTLDAGAARETSARLVVEGANLPCTLEAQEVLAARGITVVPDFIANAGGVVAAAYSMDARYSPFRVEPTPIFDSISARLRENTRTVLETSRSRGLTPHRTARVLAQERVAEAMRLRGRLPRSQVIASG